jgi:hypothetical protein
VSQHKYCHACGSELHIEAEICPRCGVRQRFGRIAPEGSSDRKILPAFLFAFFLGVLGVHRFYVGKTGTGIVMVVVSLTVVGLIVTAIWSLIDWILIVSGNFRDKEGRVLTEWS